ncbi:MAG: dephospho-CoA kinase [Candidatus Shapirobacteria bacterium]|nr:dephospho-CoA kinase [Candidatus Shapirobacteria bacterium]
MIETEKRIFALTGGMGCGKSTVGKFLKKYPDIYVFDCDKVAKNIMSDNKNLEEIKSILGEGVIDNEKINRQKIAQIIFTDTKKKEALENFIHPKVWGKLAKEIQKSEDGKIFIVESAIFYEIEKEKDIDKVIVVTCDKDEQIKRIKSRNGWTDEQIEKRLKHQLPNEVKEAKGLAVINSNCSFDELKQKTEILYSYVKSGGNYRLVL